MYHPYPWIGIIGAETNFPLTSTYSIRVGISIDSILIDVEKCPSVSVLT